MHRVARRYSLQELSGIFSSLKFLYVGRLANEAAQNCTKRPVLIKEGVC
jgi:hypothetical protein